MTSPTPSQRSGNAREEILGKIRQALAVPSEPMVEPDWNVNIYERPGLDAITEFAENFVARKGSLYPCQDHEQFRQVLAQVVAEKGLQHIKVWEKPLADLIEGSIDFDTTDQDLASVQAGLTFCEVLVARTGSFITTSKQTSGRRLTIYPPLHMVVAYTSQLVDDIKDGFDVIRSRYGADYPSMIGLVTGASRTADIEKTLVLGAHGPKELVMFLIDDAGLRHN